MCPEFRGAVAGFCDVIGAGHRDYECRCWQAVIHAVVESLSASGIGSWVGAIADTFVEAVSGVDDDAVRGGGGSIDFAAR